MKAASLLGLVRTEARCPITPIGIDLKRAIIVGDLNLDSAIGEAGGPLCPLAFTDCHFKGAVSARHAHLSRLSLARSTFGPCETPAGEPPAPPIQVIDLSGAKLDSELELAGIQPELERGSLWLCARGASVGGGVELSGCRLRAPARLLASGQGANGGEDALDLSLARIGGDLRLDKFSHFDGRLKLRSAEVRGDLWLNTATIWNPGADTEALLLQSARVDGFLSTRKLADPIDRLFACTGNINLMATGVGRSLILRMPRLTGDIQAPDLDVGDDFYLHGKVTGRINLERSSIGGSLDISRLEFEAPVTPGDGTSEPVLCLQDARIGAVLRLTPKPTKAKLAAGLPDGFRSDGIVDLRGAACDTLDDGVGQSWNGKGPIWMNHFAYRRTGWLSGGLSGAGKTAPRRRSHQLFANWLKAKLADGAWPAILLPRFWRPDYWESWQLRRNWIYRQYESNRIQSSFNDPFVSITRHRIREDQYRPQPFEQAIRVARGEGREASAIQLEIHKQRLEWRFLNQRVRWGLGLVGIVLSASWLIVGRESFLSVLIPALALFATLVLMIFGSWIRAAICGRIILPLLRSTRRAALVLLTALAAVLGLLALNLAFALPTFWIGAAIGALVVAAVLAVSGSWLILLLYRPIGKPASAIAAKVPSASSKVLTWIIYWLPAIFLLIVDGWYAAPFHFIVAFLIFAGIRLTTVIAHQIMRFGVGYMRRPINAFVSLIFAFLLGWWGVHVANSRGMLVIAAEPVATLAAPDSNAHFPADHGVTGVPVLMASGRVGEGPDIARELPCAAIISEPLYALDILVPIVDLREESRCEVRRVPPHGHQPPDPATLSIAGLWVALPGLAFDSHRFWWWAQAFYALLGWVLVSLSILTFAQVNKTHAEPQTEHK